MRTLKGEMETIAAQKNEVSKQIPKASKEERAAMIEEMREVDVKADKLSEEFTPLNEELTELLYTIPNPPLADVIVAKSDEENVVLRSVGEIPTFDFTPKDHMEIGEALGIIDTARAAK